MESESEDVQMQVQAAFLHQVAKLLRLVENRKCADCSAVLGDSKSTYAQVKHSVWVCKKCAEYHNRFVSSDGLMLALSRTWTVEALEAMVQAGSNLKQNRILERYSNGLTKATPDSSDDQRELWIRCKYRFLFAIPALSEDEQVSRIAAERNAPVGRQSEAADASSVSMKGVGDGFEGHKKLLPIRFVDYFVTIGPGVHELPRRPRASVPPAKPPRLTGGSGLASASSLQTETEAEAAPPVPLPLPLLPPLPAKCEELSLQACLDNCFPPATTYQDALPDQCAPFIFPSGLHFSSEDRAPSVSTFVLTDANRVKVFGAALIFYELLDPEEVALLVTPTAVPENYPELDVRYDYKKALASRRQEIAAKPGWHMVYAPKALALTGHYAFYSAFTEFLADIYRTSLSAAPVPIERFINQFVVETPLPPMGRIEVCVALPSKTLSISRPAVNKLPMVDFSYRPLFAYLSVDHIITVLKMICGEYSICFVSKRLALLTPIQEAILSFLFPLVWQGVYIPILPKHMMEILDAPVPIVAGIHSSYIEHLPLNARPAEVIFVDIDKDEIYLGGALLHSHPFPELASEFDSSGFRESRNNIIDYLQQPLPKMFVKLRAKMTEFGACIYRTPTAMTLQETAGLAYPNQEHLTPLSVFAMETGTANMNANNRKGRFTGQAATIGYGGDADNQGIRPLLSPSNNCESGTRWDKNDKFDAVELRSAFLRFFVALFIDTDSHQEALEQAMSQPGSSRTSVARSTMGGMSMRAKATALEPFYLAILGTQMYSEFKDERRFTADMPEIRYFEESIAEKRNRSRFTFRGQSTPFLNSSADDINETYTPPTPSVSGLSVGQKFEYQKWPQLRAENVGPMRPIRVLLKGGAEKLRKANKLQEKANTASRYSVMVENFQLEHPGSKAATSATQSTSSDQMEVMLIEGSERYRRTCANITKMQSIVRMRAARKCWTDAMKSVVRIQCMFRAYFSSKKLRGMQMLNNLREQIALVVKIQSALRALSARKKYTRMYRLVLWLQATYRAGDHRKKFLETTGRLRKVSAVMRGLLARIHDGRRREALFLQYRHQLILLWKLEHTTLHYRSLFWIMIRVPTYLHLAILRDELYRLYTSVGLLDIITKGLPVLVDRDSKDSKRLSAHRMSTSNRRRATTIDSLVERAGDTHVAAMIDATNSCRLVEAVGSSKVWELIEKVQGISSGSDALAQLLGAKFQQLNKCGIEGDRAEREALYKIMKDSISAADLSNYYVSFGVDPAAKKKKDTVVYRLLFNEDTGSQGKLKAMQLIDTSATLLIHVHHGKDGRGGALSTHKGGWGSSLGFGGAAKEMHLDMSKPTFQAEGKASTALDEWFQRKKGERIRAASLETLRVCLTMVAAQKSRKNKVAAAPMM